MIAKSNAPCIWYLKADFLSRILNFGDFWTGDWGWIHGKFKEVGKEKTEKNCELLPC